MWYSVSVLLLTTVVFCAPPSDKCDTSCETYEDNEVSRYPTTITTCYCRPCAARLGCQNMTEEIDVTYDDGDNLTLTVETNCSCPRDPASLIQVNPDLDSDEECTTTVPLIEKISISINANNYRCKIISDKISDYYQCFSSEDKCTKSVKIKLAMFGVIAAGDNL